MRRDQDFWTPERIDKLRVLWAKNLSAWLIARELGGCTRSAVLGKVNRLGLSTRRVLKPKHKAPRKPRSKTFNFVNMDKPLPRPSVAAQTAFGQTKTLPNLDRHDCRWPLGDGPFVFCAAEREFDSPYCPQHSAVAYNAPNRR